MTAAVSVLFSLFFRYMEEAEHAMWREAGLSIAPPGSDIGFPRVATNFEFFRPLRFEDEFEGVLMIARKSQKSLSYTAEIRASGETVARGALTIACVTKVPGQPLRGPPLPAGCQYRGAE